MSIQIESVESLKALETREDRAATSGQPARKRVVIVGAGVAGCLMARALAMRPELDVTCLERVSPDDHSEAGTGLNIGPNAIKALHLRDPILAGAIGEASLPWDHWRVSLTDGEVLFDVPLARVADHGGVRIRWAELYRVLRKAAGATVRYDCQVLATGRGVDGRPFVQWEQHGERHRLDDIDLLIAADGRYSRTRVAFSGAPAIRQVGVAIFRLLVPDTSGGLIDDYEQWFNGPNRLLAFRVPDGHIYMAGTFPITPGTAVPEHGKSVSALRAAYTPAPGEPSAQARWLIDTICANTDAIHWARMQESSILYADSHSPVLYLGDSAHAMVPTLGQGATQAIEDACCAAELIGSALDAGVTEAREWLAAIEAARAARMQFVMTLSLEATDTMLTGADPRAGTLKKTEAPFMSALQQLYCDVDLPQWPTPVPQQKPLATVLPSTPATDHAQGAANL